ncbi:MAG: transposase [Planctomycetaceae bacterium]
MYTIDPTTGRAMVRKCRRRSDDERGPHELTFSCFRRYQFLNRDRTRKWFVESLQKARRKWHVDVWAYVLMPEHVHLLVAPRRTGTEIGRFAGSVKQAVASRAIHWLEKSAPEWLPRITVAEGTIIRRRFWQPGGGYDRSVEQLATLQSMIDYIHANPVRRGLVDRPENWVWSSAQWYLGYTDVPIEMDRTLPMFHA